MSDQPVTQAQLKLSIDELEAKLEVKLEEQRNYLLERLEKTETTLLKEFRKWAIPMQSRVKVHDALLTGIDQRVTLIEERLDEMEQRGQ